MAPAGRSEEPRRQGRRHIAGLLAALALLTPVSAADLEDLAEIARELCLNAGLDPEALARRVGAKSAVQEVQNSVQDVLHFRFPDGAMVQFAAARPGEVLRRVVVERHLPDNSAGGLRPDALVILDGVCTLHHGRQIRYDQAGRALDITLHGPGLAEIAAPEPLNPPMPRRPDDALAGEGVVVALFDSGLAYTLPGIARRLVYDRDGRALGYDFWDLDDRPFDADTSRSPFFPARHGTRVASVVLREAPEARVVPFRYPRPDMALMADMVAAAAEAGARIVLVPMGSRDPGDWAAFAAAARAEPEILFVLSAGNDDRNLDEEPLWPAALGLDNAVVVTSAEDDGRLASGSNWGPRTVDLMVPGERVPAIDHRGAPAVGSGTSFAAPRVVALAARMLAADPAMGVAELKAALISRATPAQPVRHGFIADPAADD